MKPMITDFSEMSEMFSYPLTTTAEHEFVMQYVCSVNLYWKHWVEEVRLGLTEKEKGLLGN